MGKGIGMGMCRTILAGFAAALAHVALAQTAALPATYTGPWRDALPPDGWTFSGLGAPDYLPGFDGFGDGAAKLDGTGDFISVRFAAPPESVSFWIQGFSFSGGVFRVEQSIDGTNWLTLASYASPPTNATFQTYGLSHHARHVRFLYQTRVTGNVGLDGISLVPFTRARFGTITVTGSVATLAVADSMPGRTYQLEHAAALTNEPVVWTAAGSPASGGGTLVFTNSFPTNATKRYYRVRDVTPAEGRRLAVPAAAPAPVRAAPRERPLWR